MSVTILSMNCQGLGDSNKRKDIFTFLRKSNGSIFCLQDTHFQDADKPFIRAQWGYDCVLNHFKSNARGVAILFNNNFTYKITKMENNVDGNMLALNIEFESHSFTLINIYGPNKDSPSFSFKNP